MQQQPPRGGSGQHAAAFSFEAKVENEEPLVDAMLASLARSALPADAWERLHARGSARRSAERGRVRLRERVAGQAACGPSQPAVAAEFLFQAGRFFGDVFGDEVGAVAYLERALALAPGHAAAFAKLDELLTVEAAAAQEAGRGLRGAPRSTGRAASRCRSCGRAAALLAEAGGADEKVIELLQSAPAARAGRRGRPRAPRGALRQGQPLPRRGAPERAGARGRAAAERRDAARAARARSSSSTRTGSRSPSARCRTSSSCSRSIRRTRARAGSRRSSWSSRGSRGAPRRRSRRRSRRRARRRRSLAT